MQELQPQLQLKSRPQPRPVQLLEEALAAKATPEVTLGVYDTSRMADDPFRWAEAVKTAWSRAPEGSEERRAFLDLQALCTQASPAPTGADVALRRQLWGASGAASDPLLVARGVQHFHAALQKRFERMDEVALLVETVRCYGDYLTYYHPDGQREEGPPFGVYTPFRDMLAPSLQANPEEELTPQASEDVSELRARLLEELSDADLPAPVRSPDLEHPPSLLLRRPEERPAHLRPTSAPEPQPSRLTQLRDAGRRHAPGVLVSTLAFTVLDLLRGGGR